MSNTDFSTSNRAVLLKTKHSTQQEGPKMQKSRYTQEQIQGALDEAERGVKVKELCAKYGISESTFYKWKSQQGVNQDSKDRRINKLEEENRRLKALVADLSLRNESLKRIVSKKW